MSQLRVPDFLYNRTAHLVDAFCEVAAVHGRSRQEAESLFRILPQETKSAPAFLDKIGNCWRYDYGDEIDRLPNNQVALGLHNCPEVEHLFLGIRAINVRFTEPELKSYLDRLSFPSKHHEVLFELAPLIRIGEEVLASFEVSGIGPGNTSVDWLFLPPTGIPVALDVKYRYKDVISHLESITYGMGRSEPEVGGGPADPAIFFKSLVNKFNPSDPTVQLQGGWVHALIKSRRHELEQAFADLDQERLHFAILNTWGPEAYIIARPEVDVEYLRNLFRLEQSNNFVVDEASV